MWCTFYLRNEIKFIFEKLFCLQAGQLVIQKWTNVGCLSRPLIPVLSPLLIHPVCMSSGYSPVHVICSRPAFCTCCYLSWHFSPWRIVVFLSMVNCCRFTLSYTLLSTSLYSIPYVFLSPSPNSWL